MPPTSEPLASSHRLKHSVHISPPTSEQLVIKALAASLRRLTWPAPFLEERWLEVALLVTYASEEAYESICVEEGRKRLFGLWKAGSLSLPEATEWACRWGWPSWQEEEETLVTPAEEQPCQRSGSANERDWCEEAAECEHCEGRRGPPTRTLTCPLPSYVVGDSWPAAPDEIPVWLVNNKFGEDFSLFMILEPELPPVAATACTHLLYGLEEQSRWRPDAVHQWLKWHLERLKLDRIVVYDLDGSFGRVVQVDQWHDSVIYYPSFISNISNALAALARPRAVGSTLYGFHENSTRKRPHPRFTRYRESSRCAPAFVTADILAQHCLLHHRSSSKWFLHLHTPDLWLFPPGVNTERKLSDLIEPFDHEGVADLRVHGFDMVPSYFYDPFQKFSLDLGLEHLRGFGPKFLEELERMYCKPLTPGAIRRSFTHEWCRNQFQAKPVDEVLLEHDMYLYVDPSIHPWTWSLCNSELTELFGNHYCVRRPFSKTVELTRSPEEWHLRHWSHLYPINCDDELSMQRLCDRLLFPHVVHFSQDRFLSLPDYRPSELK